jgi:outer membrane protein assembly factor BamB
MTLRRYAWILIAALAAPLAGDDQWAQFHGPRRDNISTETNLLQHWPVKGPKLLWARRGVGRGFATVSIVGGKIYTAGNIDDQTVITALGLDGKIIWQTKNGPLTKRAYPGARGTPTLCCGKLYHLAPDGAMICLNAETGKEIWSLNVLETFKGENCKWGLSESVLIDGKNVICTVGGKKTSIVALDKKTGKTVWESPSIGDQPGYASPVIVKFGGLRQIVTGMAKSIVAVSADTGKLLWRFKHEVRLDQNIMTPIHHEGHIFVSGPGAGGTLLKMKVTGKKCTVKPAWKNPKMGNAHGGVVLSNGYLFGHSDRGSRLSCVEFKTGRTMYSEDHDAAGKKSASLTLAGGMLYILSDDKVAHLVPADPKAFKPVSSFKILPGGSGPLWAHPVVFDGRLYIRHDKLIMAYDIRAK